tara:strand:- start:169573 stop:170094 length:522 start_codon:yes stop_codon:yes gene_type:complete
MKAQDLLALGLRMAGIYLALITSKAVMETLYYLKLNGVDEQGSGWLAGQLTFTSLYILTSATLLLFPLTTSRFLLPSIEAEKELQMENVGQLRSIAFSLLGVYLVVDALPEIGSTLGWLWLQLNEEYSELNAYNYVPGSIALVLQLLIGVGLCIFPVPLDHLLERLRQAGLRK